MYYVAIIKLILYPIISTTIPCHVKHLSQNSVVVVLLYMLFPFYNILSIALIVENMKLRKILMGMKKSLEPAFWFSSPLKLKAINNKRVERRRPKLWKKWNLTCLVVLTELPNLQLLHSRSFLSRL